MQRRIELEERLCGAWSELGSALHPEDAFVCRWLRWLAPATEQRAQALAVALEALDLVDGPDGRWPDLVPSVLLHRLPKKDGGRAWSMIGLFVAWLTHAGVIDVRQARRLRQDLALPTRRSDRNQIAMLAA